MGNIMDKKILRWTAMGVIIAIIIGLSGFAGYTIRDDVAPIVVELWNRESIFEEDFDISVFLVEERRNGVYSGEILNDDRNGFGVFRSNEGHVFLGNWENDTQTSGILKHSNGDVYIGAFRNGRRHGEGVMIYANNEIYLGEWRNDIRNGTGFYFHLHDVTFLGLWVDNVRNGEGISMWADGSTFEGYWVNGSVNGEGIHSFANGRYHICNWVDGEKVGEIRCYNADGSLCCIRQVNSEQDNLGDY